jgi:hypothetical protein
LEYHIGGDDRVDRPAGRQNDRDGITARELIKPFALNIIGAIALMLY